MLLAGSAGSIMMPFIEMENTGERSGIEFLNLFLMSCLLDVKIWKC